VERKDPRMRVCPICKKEFLLPYENVYRLLIRERVVDYCSWTCYRKAQKEKQKTTRNYRTVRRAG